VEDKCVIDSDSDPQCAVAIVPSEDLMNRTHAFTASVLLFDQVCGPLLVPEAIDSNYKTVQSMGLLDYQFDLLIQNRRFASFLHYVAPLVDSGVFFGGWSLIDQRNHNQLSQFDLNSKLSFMAGVAIVENNDFARGVDQQVVLPLLAARFGATVVASVAQPSEAGILAKFADLYIPTLRNVEPEQLLHARDLLKDQAHPLRLILRQVAHEIDLDSDQKARDALIAERLLPHLLDYRRAFESRLETILTVAQHATKDFYAAIVAFAATTLATNDASIGLAAGIATPVIDAAVRYFTERAKLGEKKRRHPFGFLERMDKRRRQ